MLAVIPRLRSHRPIFLPVHELNDKKGVSEPFLFADAFQNLRVAVQLAMRADNIRTVLVASPFPAEGKSTVVINLGLAFREAGQRVVLADTDFHRPTLHRAMKVSQNGGFVEALRGETSIENSLTPVGEGMWLVPRGATVHRDSRGMLATARLKEVVGEMAARGDLVLCDSSPILVVPDNLFLARAVDAVILVAKAGSTRCRDLARAKALLESVGAKIAGVVINEMPSWGLRRYYNRYYKPYVRSGTK
ncbi:MAG: CpsD/CapB family tyrosine-protein kinase [Planctomycetes bacterium]|nr:CpsD/CapB family tyrosine-protein kinase [Planctomycetota bacterium]